MFLTAFKRKDKRYSFKSTNLPNTTVTFEECQGHQMQFEQKKPNGVYDFAQIKKPR